MGAETKVYDIVGYEMSAVSFVRDYIEFHFEEKVLRAIANPSIRTETDTATFPQSGCRDIFCALIGKCVTDVIVREKDSIELQFDDKSVIRIPLSDDTRFHGEAAHYVPDMSQPIEVW